MPTRPLLDTVAQDALNLVTKHGSITLAASELGIHERTLGHRVNVAKARGMSPTIKIAPHAPQAAIRGSRVLAIGDLHTPFMHQDAYEFLKYAQECLKPNKIVLLGDEVDQHALAQFDPDPDGYSAGHEAAAAREQLKPLFTLFPDAKICTSNHTERVYKRAYRAGIPRCYLKDYADWLGAPLGWHWDHKFTLDGVIYEHGEGVTGRQASEKKMLANMAKTVIGHIHAHAGVYFFNNGYTQIWGMNAGCLIDHSKYAFKYAKHSVHKPILGVGFVDCGEPHFYPMRLDNHKRWTGRL